jgi:heme exporter protein C
MWGTFWVWDARLTSVLVLLFLYLGYIALVSAFDDPERGARAGAILALVGWINVPIVKFSVDWWNTLHQPASLLRADGPSMTAAYLTPLLTMMAAYAVLFAAVWITGVRTEVMGRRLRTLRARRAMEA